MTLAHALLGALVAPTVLSLLVFAAWRVCARDRRDLAEKAMLGLLIAPYGVGVIVLLFADQAPASVAPAVSAWAEWGRSAAEFAGPARAAVSEGLGGAVAGVAGWAFGALGSLYCLIALARLVRLVRDMRRLWAFERAGAQVGEARLASGRVAPVIRTHAAAPAFASLSGAIVLPATLVTTPGLSRGGARVSGWASGPLGLIIAHEAAHLSRRDPLWFLMLAVIDALLWGHPAVRAQTNRCRLAAELACDATVLAARDEADRRAYARALVVAARSVAVGRSALAPSAILTHAHGDTSMRLRAILQPAPRRSRLLAVGALAATAGAVTSLALVQAAYAQATAPATVPTFAVIPLQGRVSSTYGERTDPLTHQVRHHDGIDIAAPLGAPIHAPDSGSVVRLETGLEGYGNLLEIDHGAGYVTRFSQLKSFDVALGDTVAAGQLIARVGSSGRSTGPHLHLEVYRDGERLDPADVLVIPE